jgi:hypothetical protein
LSDTDRTAIAEEFIELIDDVTGKVVRCRKFVAPPVNPGWPLYFTNAAREREQRADATLPIVDWPGIRISNINDLHAGATVTLTGPLISLDFPGSS